MRARGDRWFLPGWWRFWDDDPGPQWSSTARRRIGTTPPPPPAEVPPTPAGELWDWRLWEAEFAAREHDALAVTGRQDAAGTRLPHDSAPTTSEPGQVEPEPLEPAPAAEPPVLQPGAGPDAAIADLAETRAATGAAVMASWMDPLALDLCRKLPVSGPSVSIAGLRITVGADPKPSPSTLSVAGPDTTDAGQAW